MAELYQLTISELHEKLKSREVSAVEICRSVLARIEAVEPKLGAFLLVEPERALASAERVDRELARGSELKPLGGIPIAIKDNICTRGMRTTCASRILYNFVPPYDATAVARLRAQGAVIIGKTNLDEFAMGSSTENSGFKLTRNPWDAERVPGGSSGGSAAAVAAQAVPAALGSDTGGSVRQPAGLCGVFGLKPTYGRVSRYGLVAFASSLDQIGPLARSARDIALVLEAIAGHDPCDSTSAPVPVPEYARLLEQPLPRLRIGVPREFFGSGLDPEVRSCIESGVKTLESLGCRIVDISLPHTEYAIATYYIIAPAEASSNLARYDGVRYGLRIDGSLELSDMYGATRSSGFGAEVKRRIMVGTYVLSAGYYDAYYLKAQKARTLIRRDYEEALAKVEVIVTPTSPTTAFKIGEKIADPLEMYLSDIYTVTSNLAGVPAISIPCGLSRGLPVGMQLIGNYFEEDKLLALAHGFEQLTLPEQKHPQL